MKTTVTVTLGEILERAKALNERHGFKPWDALENAVEDARDEVSNLELAATALLEDKAMPWLRGDKTPDWDALIRRARGET